MGYNVGTKVFGDWEITKEIGEGANGKVFLAQKSNYGIVTQSALKVITIPPSREFIKDIRQEGMDEQSVTSYFRSFVDEIVKEIETMSHLKGHPNIVSYEDHCVIAHEGEIGWDILIRMELLTPLMDYYDKYLLNEAMVVRLGKEIGSAVAYCHKNGILHRDIKPENIFVSKTGQFKLGDFGIARTVEKTTGGLSKKGTESYMAPEVYLGKAYGQNVDIYSLGMVLYRLMNGKRLPFLPPVPKPITWKDKEQALEKRMSGQPVPFPADASEEFGRIIQKACAFDPEVRYHSADEMLHDLASLYVEGGFCTGHGYKSSSFSYREKSVEEEQTVGLKRDDNLNNSKKESIKEKKSSRKKRVIIFVGITIFMMIGSSVILTRILKSDNKNEIGAEENIKMSIIIPETEVKADTIQEIYAITENSAETQAVLEAETTAKIEETARIIDASLETGTDKVLTPSEVNNCSFEGNWYYIVSEFKPGIAIHPLPNKNSDTLGTIPHLAEFYVEYISDKYGYTSYNGCVGWINIGDYADKVISPGELDSCVYDGSRYYITSKFEPGIAIHPIPNKKSDTLGVIPHLAEFDVEFVSGKYGYTSYNGCVGWINIEDYALPINK